MTTRRKFLLALAVICAPTAAYAGSQGGSKFAKKRPVSTRARSGTNLRGKPGSSGSVKPK